MLRYHRDGPDGRLLAMGADQFHYELEHGTRDRVSIVLHGTLMGSSLPGLDDDVRAALDELPSGGHVVVDLTNVARCDPSACRALARIQRRLRAHGCRTAWLAARPRIRGAAWWIVHASRDPRAMPVTNVRFAEDWLTTDGTRLDELNTRTSSALERTVDAFSSLMGGGR